MKGNCVLKYQKKEGLFTKTRTMFGLGIQKKRCNIYAQNMA